MSHILAGYHLDKHQELEAEADRMRKSLRELQYSVKLEQESMQRLIKIYVTQA